jgi:ribosomal protein S18 acetylase RimI-like enzyme
MNVRAARDADAEAVARLLYESAGGMYDRFAGSHEGALRLLRRGFETPGNNASSEVIRVVELDGVAVAASAAFPVEETPPRASAFLRLALASTPPWRWPSALWLYWAGARAAPSPPRSCLYLDALATDAPYRRRGAARALLEEAETRAHRMGLHAVAVDTSLENRAARALYLRAGYREVAYRSPARGLPGFVALVKPLS